MSKAEASARVEFRMSSSLKKEVEEAAALLGTTFTSFATEVLVERSRQVKREHNITMMGDQEREAFLQLISEPSEPNEALKKLMHIKADL